MSAHFVRPGTALDKEAYERGTSVYFPGRVIPMLPEKLSNNLCSLVPDKDRLTFSAILDFDRSGKRLQKSFCRSIIRSRHRFTYTTVKNILIDKDFNYPARAQGFPDSSQMGRRTCNGTPQKTNGTGFHRIQHPGGGNLPG